MKRLIVAISCVLFASPAFAQKVGDTVVVIAENKTELKAGDDVVGTVVRGDHLRVDDVNGEWFWVLWEGKRGWINRSDVIHIDKAISVFTDAIRRNPTALDYSSRGMMWRAKGKNDIAIRDYNEAIRLDPKYASPYNNRGNSWYDKGQLDKAIRDYNEAIRLDPKFDAAYNNRGIAWSDKGHNDKAISDYSEAIRLNPKYVVAYNNRGIAWFNKVQYDKAISDYSEAIRLDPKDAHPYNGIAWIHATCPIARYRDGRRAVENARKACELTDWEYYINIDTLAAAYAESGDFSEAVKWQKKAIALVPAKMKADLRSRLSRYKSGKPYREKPKK